MPASHCALRRSGTITVQLCTSASEEEYPNILVAAAFHRTILPLRASATTTASRMLSRSWSMPKSCSLTSQITPPLSCALLQAYIRFRGFAIWCLPPTLCLSRVAFCDLASGELLYANHLHIIIARQDAKAQFADGDHAARERHAVGEVVHAGDLDNDSLGQTSS